MQEKKNILVMIEDVSGSGGTERVAITLANEFSRRGYPVTIHSLKLFSSKPFYPVDKEVKIVQHSGINRYMAILRSLKLPEAQPSILIVISMGRLSIEAGLLSIFANRKLKIILSEHCAYEAYNPVIRFFKRIAFKLVNNVVFLTNNDRLLFKGNKYHTIKNINPFDNYSIDMITPYESRDKIAIAVGRFSHQKNFLELISIWKNTPKKNWVLYLIGDGEDYASLKNAACTDNTIHFIKTSENITDYYNKARLILMTSLYEGLPMVLIESQSFGVPAISYACKTGPDEIILNEQTGYLIPVGDKENFIEHLRLATSNDELMSHFSNKSKRASTRFSNDTIMKAWLSLVE